MIIAHIGPTGISKVLVRADSEAAEDAALAIWPVVRDQLKQLDHKLREGSEKPLTFECITLSQQK